MTLRKEINHKILQAVNTKYNYSSSKIKVDRIQDTTDQICQLVKERLEIISERYTYEHKARIRILDDIDTIITELSGGNDE